MTTVKTNNKYITEAQRIQVMKMSCSDEVKDIILNTLANIGKNPEFKLGPAPEETKEANQDETYEYVNALLNILDNSIENKYYDVKPGEPLKLLAPIEQLVEYHPAIKKRYEALKEAASSYRDWVTYAEDSLKMNLIGDMVSVATLVLGFELIDFKPTEEIRPVLFSRLGAYVSSFTSYGDFRILGLGNTSNFDLPEEERYEALSSFKGVYPFLYIARHEIQHREDIRELVKYWIKEFSPVTSEIPGL